LLLQSFCQPRRLGQKQAVTVKRVPLQIPPSWNNCLSGQILWSRLLHIDNAEEPQ